MKKKTLKLAPVVFHVGDEVEVPLHGGTSVRATVASLEDSAYLTVTHKQTGKLFKAGRSVVIKVEPKVKIRRKVKTVKPK